MKSRWHCTCEKNHWLFPSCTVARNSTCGAKLFKLRWYYEQIYSYIIKGLLHWCWGNIVPLWDISIFQQYFPVSVQEPYIITMFCMALLLIRSMRKFIVILKLSFKRSIWFHSMHFFAQSRGLYNARY